MASQNLLLISYLFPPAGGVAVQRALSLARYLPRCGYKVHVLSCRNPGVATMDPSLLARVPPEVTVHRTLSPELPLAARKRLWGRFSGGAQSGPSAARADTRPPRWKGLVREGMRRIFCPDPEVVWNPLAMRRARRLVRKHGIDSIIVTAPPFSSFLIANRLRREFPYLTVAADFRDAWLGYYLDAFDFYKGPYMRRRAERWERETVELADLVVSVTQAMNEELRARYPDQSEEKFACIPNGYDADALAGFRSRARQDSKVVITYCGTLHGSSSPRFYLEGLDALPEEIRDAFETRFIGRVAPEEAKYLEGRQSLIRTYGFLPQAEAFQYLEETDYVLLTQLHAPSQPGKVFEYLATGKPILAITARDGEVAHLLAETGAGWYADPADPAAITAMLERAALALRRGEQPCRPDPEAIARYDRSRLAAEYAGRLRAARSS